jgi:uncharacterized protein YacL
MNVAGLMGLLVGLVMAVLFLRVIFIMVLDMEMPILLKGMLFIGVPLIVAYGFIVLISSRDRLGSRRHRKADLVILIQKWWKREE